MDALLASHSSSQAFAVFWAIDWLMVAANHNIAAQEMKAILRIFMVLTPQNLNPSMVRLPSA
jgi:hypothetical protein